ncbi:hypothetical protein CEXT_255961 [Caerostris extrusa]|uniref:Uncharacterized protein n=1 Tax=Caerostris extrusa TaxID=172846 RepID=A0AAV4WLH5_CAEEX|nr:hypothetical protein CEXT_255961 [Caerostris extrusa]
MFVQTAPSARCHGESPIQSRVQRMSREAMGLDSPVMAAKLISLLNPHLLFFDIVNDMLPTALSPGLFFKYAYESTEN